MGVNKVVFNTADGEHTLIDISDSTVTADTLAKGKTAYGANGEKITGTMEAGGGGGSGDSFENDIIARSLSGIYKNDTITYVGIYAFTGCYDLFAVDLPYVDFIEGGAFMECSSLMAVILRNTESVCGQSWDNFMDTPISNGVGFVYVPSALIEDYRASDFWTNLSPSVEFRAIEDYTLDGTVTGEMDWELIESEQSDNAFTIYILEGDPLEAFEIMQIPATDMSWYEWVESGALDELFGFPASITEEGDVVVADTYYVVLYFDGMGIEDISLYPADWPVCDNEQNAIYLMPMEYFQ